jgi:hypothetical protein
MIDVAKKVIVLADSTKMNIRGFDKICNLNRIDVLITDSGIDNATKAELEELDKCCYCRQRIILLSNYVGLFCERQVFFQVLRHSVAYCFLGFILDEKYF